MIYVLFRNASLTSGDQQMRTPLMAAVFYKNVKIVEYLFKVHYNSHMEEIQKMTDVEQRNILHLAILSRDNAIISCLLRLVEDSVLSVLRRGADSKGNLPLHSSAQTGAMGELTSTFINLHSDTELRIRNEMGQTVFHVAAKHGSSIVIQVILLLLSI